jgi:tetratricopeptide (TPR) repeat protein
MALALLSGCSSSNPADLWSQAITAYQEHRYEQAEAVMARLAKLREPTAEDHLMRAQLALVHDDNDVALSELAQVTADSPITGRARLEQGQIELRRHRVRLAEKYLLEAVKFDPKLARARKELIYIYGFQLRRADLSVQFRELAKVEPLAFDQIFLWCLTRGVVWEPQEAANALALQVDTDPDDLASRLALAETLRRLNQPDEAEKRLAPIPDDNPDARAIRAQIAVDRGDAAAADSLLAGGPKRHIGLALLRGRIAQSRSDDEAALAAFREAVAAEPDNRDAVLGLSQTLRRVGSPEAAHYADLSAKHERLNGLVQRAAIPGSMTKPDLIKELGAACAAIGRLPEARSWYTLAIRFNTLDTEAQQALYRIKDDKPSS